MAIPNPNLNVTFPKPEKYYLVTDYPYVIQVHGISSLDDYSYWCCDRTSRRVSDDMWNLRNWIRSKTYYEISVDQAKAITSLWGCSVKI